MRNKPILALHQAGSGRWPRIFLTVMVAAALVLGVVGPAPAATDEPEAVDEVLPEIAAHYTTDDDPGRDTASFSVTGVLRDEEGAPLPDTDVGLSLDPGPELLLDAGEEDSDALVLTLASGTTDAAGRFTLRAPALREIGGYLDEDGEVALLITSFGNFHTLIARIYATLPTNSGGPALAGSVDEQYFPAAAVAAAAEGEPVAVANLAMTAAPASIESVEPAHHGGSSAHCAGSPLGQRWVKTGSEYTRWHTIQIAYTGSKLELQKDWETTHSTQMTTAIEWNISSSRGSARGGYTKSASNTTGAGVGQHFGRNQRKWHDVNWAWQNYKYQCIYKTGGWSDSGYREARPITFTGGARVITYPSTRSCGSNTSWRVPVPSGGSLRTFTEASNSTTYSGNFSIFGVSLNVKHSGLNSQSHRTMYANTASSTAYVCGTDNYPARTLNTREA